MFSSAPQEPSLRLKSRRPFMQASVQLMKLVDHDNNVSHWMDQAWNMEWSNIANRFRPRSKTRAVIFRPTPEVKLDWLRAGIGRFLMSMYKWRLASSTLCNCDAEQQTADHAIEECPIYKASKGVCEMKILEKESEV